MMLSTHLFPIIIITMALKLASGSYDNTIKFWDPSNGTSNPT